MQYRHFPMAGHVQNISFWNIDKSLRCCYKQNKSNETILRLLINTVPAYMPIDEMKIVRWFISSLRMVYFKQKNRTCKSDSLFIVKSRIESYKSGYRGIDNCIYFTINRERTRVDVHIATINRFQPEGWPRKLLLQLLSLDASRWKKVPGTFLKKSAALVIHRV